MRNSNGQLRQLNEQEERQVETLERLHRQKANLERLIDDNDKRLEAIRAAKFALMAEDVGIEPHR